jgi:hypothetical protein
MKTRAPGLLRLTQRSRAGSDGVGNVLRVLTLDMERAMGIEPTRAALQILWNTAFRAERGLRAIYVRIFALRETT